jgi:hypothetical protein
MAVVLKALMAYVCKTQRSIPPYPLRAHIIQHGGSLLLNVETFLRVVHPPLLTSSNHNISCLYKLVLMVGILVLYVFMLLREKITHAFSIWALLGYSLRRMSPPNNIPNIPVHFNVGDNVI